MDRLAAIQSNLKVIQSNLKGLIEEYMPPCELRLESIYEQLLVLRSEIEVSIEAVEKLMNENKSSKVKSLLKKLVNSDVRVRNYRLVIKPSEKEEWRILLVDCYKALTPDWSEVFEEISLDDAIELFKNAKNIEVNGKIFESWEQVEL
jgi:hypothetical protein